MCQSPLHHSTLEQQRVHRESTPHHQLDEVVVTPHHQLDEVVVVVNVLGAVETTCVLLNVTVDEDDDDEEDGASSMLPPAGCSCDEEVLVTEVAGMVVVTVGVVGVEMSSCTVGRMDRVEERTSTVPPLSSPSISVSSAVASCSVC